MPASPPNFAPAQYEATQFHSEFGYLAPTMRFRRKLALTLKGGALGALAGAVAMFVVVMDRGEERAFTMLSTPVPTIPASMPTTSGQPTPVVPSAAPPSKRAAPTPSPAQEPSPRVVAAPSPSAPAAPTLAPSARTPAPTSLTPAQAAAVDQATVRFVPQSVALPAAVPANPSDRGPAPPPVTVGPLDLVPGAVAGAPAKAAPKPKKKIVREQPEQVARHAPIQPERHSAFATESAVPRFLRSILGL